MIERNRPELEPRGSDTPAAETLGLHILSEELFRGALIRERHRAHRSNQPFALLLFGVENAAGPDCSSIWHGALDVLAATTAGASVAGWMERGTLMGVIIPDIPQTDLVHAGNHIKAQLRRELTPRVEGEPGARLSLRVLTYPGPRSVEPFPYPEPGRPSMRARWYRVMNRGMDIIGSLTLLLILSPALLLIAALVKMGSRGPVLYRQVRIGHMAKPFTMLKFRTMCEDADPKIHQDFVTSFIKGSGTAAPGTDTLFKLTNDPRITPIGRILRSTSLDELPQFWNVLRGDMSLVGPRPPLRYEYDQYEPWHHRRLLEAKPGVTGLWQVAGRSRTTFDDMVRLDLRYVKTRSIWTDVKILLATPVAVISGKGAC